MGLSLFLKMILVVAATSCSLLDESNRGPSGQKDKSCLKKAKELSDWTPENQPNNRWGDSSPVADKKLELPAFVKRPFKKHGIILGPDDTFDAKFNPTAFVAIDPRDGKEKVFLIIRGEVNQENSDWKRRSLPYLAVSEDGIKFDMVSDRPLFKADSWFDRVGGIEDTRYMDMRLRPYVDAKTSKSYDGAIMYTAFDGDTARVATALFNHSDPFTYTKKDLIFDPKNVEANPLSTEKPGWHKSPAAIQFIDDSGQIQNILYVGEGNKHHGGIKAFSADEPFKWKWDGKDPVIRSREGYYDQNLVEAAFAPYKGKLPQWLAEETGESEGIYVFLHGDSPPHGYQVSYRIFSLKDPTGDPIYQANGPFLRPDRPYEIEGQVGRVVFASASVVFKGNMYIYYGAADSYVAVASAPLLN